MTMQPEPKNLSHAPKAPPSRRNAVKISGSGHFGMQALNHSDLETLYITNQQNQDRRSTLGSSKEMSHTTFPSDHMIKAESPTHSSSARKGEQARRSTVKISNVKLSRGHSSMPNENFDTTHHEFADIASISTLGNGTYFNQLEEKDKEIPTKFDKQVSFQDQQIKDSPWGVPQVPNTPHPLLEFPPLYFLFKQSPWFLEGIKSLYQWRWRVSFPLQRRVCCSQLLRRFGVQMTYGEVLLLLPYLGMIIGGILWTFPFPSVSLSGHMARLALIFALATGVRNSLITLMIGLPFERALSYHKLSGRIAFVNGILHTYVAHIVQINNLAVSFVRFLFLDTINASGTCLFVLIIGIIMTSVPYVRKKCFELFYFVHIIFVGIMSVCAFYHSGVLVPVLAGILWGGDLLCRKIIMACCRYPKIGRIRVISETVVELSFPKMPGFDYNAGQHLSVAVPELSIFEWHPFSIATCPREKVVTMLIRKAGNWTCALHKLAKEKTEIAILIEGPNGSSAVNIQDGDRYKSVLLFGGGIGITPIQSICNQLMYEHSKKQRNLKRLRLVFTDRDPVLMEDVDVVRRGSSLFMTPDVEDIDLRSIASGSVFLADGASQATGIASTLLRLVPPSRRTDDELCADYPFDEMDDTIDFRKARHFRMNHAKPQQQMDRPWDVVSVTDESTFQGALEEPSLQNVLDLQVYLTSKQKNHSLSDVPFVYCCRPDIKQLFRDMKAECLGRGERRVAVFVCAPARLAQIIQKCCVRFSDHELQFDCHTEYQD